MRAAIYLLGSPDQHYEQGEAVELVVQRRWNLVDTFIDDKHGGDRPGVRRLVQAAQARRFDVLVVHRLDRLFGSLHELVVLLEQLQALGVGFVSATEASIDTTGIAGPAIVQLVGAFAGLGRSTQLGRLRLGLELARRRGKRLGRPPTRFPLERARRMRAAGASYAAIAKKLGVPRTVVHRRLAAVPKSSPG